MLGPESAVKKKKIWNKEILNDFILYHFWRKYPFVSMEIQLQDTAVYDTVICGYN